MYGGLLFPGLRYIDLRLFSSIVVDRVRTRDIAPQRTKFRRTNPQHIVILFLLAGATSHISQCRRIENQLTSWVDSGPNINGRLRYDAFMAVMTRIYDLCLFFSKAL